MTGPVARAGGSGPSELSLDPFPDVERLRHPIATVLQQHPTPVFVGSQTILVDRYEALARAVDHAWGPAAIAFSFKTNYGVAESGILRERGAWAEVASAREYQLARRVGHPGSEIVFNGVAKTSADLARAVEEGAIVHVNHLDELERVIAVGSRGNGTANIGLRLTTAAGEVPESRFGFSIERGEAASAIRRLERGGLRLSGLHMHLGHYTDDPRVFARACEALGRFVVEQVSARHKVEHVDVGGGYPHRGPGPRSRQSWDPRPISEYVESITSTLGGVFDGSPRPRLILEPGRYLVGDAIVLMTTVRRVQASGDDQDLHTDASIAMLPLTHHAPHVVRVFTPSLELRAGPELPTRVWGATPREDDLLLSGPLPSASVGDLVVFYAVGAYNSTLGSSFVFDLPRLVLV